MTTRSLRARVTKLERRLPQGLAHLSDEELAHELRRVSLAILAEPDVDEAMRGEAEATLALAVAELDGETAPAPFRRLAMLERHAMLTGVPLEAALAAAVEGLTAAEREELRRAIDAELARRGWPQAEVERT